MTPRARLMSSAALLVCVLAADACRGSTRTREHQLVERSKLSMGTELHLSAWTDDDTTTLTAFASIFDEFDRLDALMSVWKRDSDVLRINTSAGMAPVPVSAEVIDVLQVARRVSDWTDGKFDVTFGALSGIWKFDQDIDGRVPARAEIEPRLPLIDYRDVKVDETARTVLLARAGMRINLGGIGKGYAVDRAIEILKGAGVADFMIQSGGDLYLGGRHGDRPWKAGIQDPRGPSDVVFAAIDLTDRAFSTSGDYERFFMRDGRRYHHILDPATGEPAAKCRSVTIVSPSATMADGLSTGVFVLGPEKGMALIERLPNVEGVIVSADNQVLVSSGLKDWLELIQPPTDAP